MVQDYLKNDSLKEVTNKKGFALVMALSLLSLVFLLVISLVNLVGIDLSLADSRKERVLAQAHARMGMMVAIGELQKHLGPDTRISATADILDERITSSKKYENQLYLKEESTSLDQALVGKNEAIDLNENGQLDVVPFGQKNWTGVWKHRARRKGASDEHRAGKPLPKNLETSDSISSMALVDSEYDPHPAIEVAWLVSGNEGWSQKLAHMQGTSVQEYVEVPDGISKDQRVFLQGGVYGQADNAWDDYRQSIDSLSQNYNHPLIELPDPEDSDDTVWMLKRPILADSFDPESPDGWMDHLRSEPIKVRKTRIRSADTSADPLTSHGSYAYWVSDEGLKTKVNMVNSLEDSSSVEDNEVKVTIAIEPNISDGSFGLEFDTPSNKPFHNAKHVNIGLLSKDEFLTGEETEKINKIAANYHSLTTSSYGLLSDTRTGGLKRDLSHAFANAKDWDESLEKSTFNWVSDFVGYLYKDRVHYLKSVPMGPNAKSNQWNDTAATESVNDYNAILSGPLWRTLGSFHNLYTKIVTSATSSGPAIVNESADRLPRVTGDNYVVFNSADGQPPSSNNPFWNQMNMPRNVAISSRLNYFRTLDKKPGPRKHPIQPVLVEVKYSHIPTITNDGYLSLAMYPSVAFWNPYNVGLDMDQLFVEIPLHQVYINAFNPKDFDRWRKWFFYAFDPDPTPPPRGGGSGRPPPFPPGFPTGGLRGPVGLSGFSGPSGSLLKNVFLQSGPRDDPYIGTDQIQSFFASLPNGPGHYRRRSGTSNFNLEYDFGRFMIAESNKPVNSTTNQLNPSRERHLLLKIDNLRLKPGEKAHYTVADKQTWNWQPRPANAVRQFLQVNLAKGTDRHSFLCKTTLKVLDDEPLLVSCGIGRIEGVHPSQMAFYNINDASRSPNPRSASNIPDPKGITIYTESPLAKNVESRKPIYKNSKSFDIGGGWNIWHYLSNASSELAETSDPGIHGDETLPGIGFRIRYKLPGNSDKVVLEQFNLRSLVQSYQDGFGDNWKEERFIGSRYRGFSPELYSRINPLPIYTHDLPYIDDDANEQDSRFSFRPNSCKFFDFYDLDPFEIGDNFDDVVKSLGSPRMHGISSAGFSPFNLNNQIMPKISSSSRSVGYFHDLDEEHGDQMSSVQSASLFEIPTSPMLSVLQLRHANLSDYSHSPSYILGNSYANPQVARYKTWGRVRAISWKPLSTVFDIGNNWTATDRFIQAYSSSGYNRSPWQVFIADNNLHMPRGQNNYGTVRDVDAQSEHQNTTVDHSYYANRALLDGYFMSGVGRDDWQAKTLAQAETEAMNFFSDPENLDLKYTPLRNTRVQPYWENSSMRVTSYGNKYEGVGSAVDSDFRYQTMAADLLVEGAFNINSTSVDAWISQLSSLRGNSSKTPFPRFINYPSENSWNKISSLSDDEIRLLAHCLVEQIKLRGPFLSFSDFVNRRVQGITSNRLDSHFSEWSNQFPETRSSVLGFRGAMQAAITEAEINQSQFQKQAPSGNSFTGSKGEWPDNPMIPFIPKTRYTGGTLATFFRPPDSMGYLNSEFGLHAISTQPFLHPDYINHTWASFNSQRIDSYVRDEADFGVGKQYEENYFAGEDANGNKLPANFNSTPPFSFKAGWDDYSSAFEFGEAPENLLAVENLATAANKPGWLMQSDVLSPLAPVTNARSDTFTIRVMGEPKAKLSSKDQSRAWIEVTVQRIPDYVKPELDAPHHRPHEPFEDRNFNGYWDNDPSFVEHWLDLNQNGMDEEGESTLPGAVPDLPGVGRTNEKNWFADGLNSDLELNADLEEESSDTKFSRMGINQRFGRKFKIIKFRWIKDQDV